MRAVVVLLLVCGSVARVAADPEPEVALATAKRLLPGAAACDDVPCALAAAYHGDAKARALALALYTEHGAVAGVGADEQMDGGYRGTIHLVPQLPTGAYRKHLAWALDAMRTIDKFFRAFPDDAAPAYRWRALAFRFVRSVGKRTPSAYATGWAIEYNVEGSLLTSSAGVTETIFHELFHVNDEAHGDWSAKTLAADYAAILARCGEKPSVRCLAPYAPNTTMVRGGTFYAFQQNNGDSVHEYAAELAVRYWKEQSEMARAKRLAAPAFKCGPPENARAWAAIVREFFGGRDLVPPCRAPR